MIHVALLLVLVAAVAVVGRIIHAKLRRIDRGVTAMQGTLAKADIQAAPEPRRRDGGIR